MCQLEHVSLNELWSDFSVLTPFEGASSGIESILRDWLDHNVRYDTKKWSFKDKSMILNYIPRENEVFSSLTYHFFNNFSEKELIRTYFGIDSPYVYVVPENILTESDIRDIASIISHATQSSAFDYPIIIARAHSDLCNLRGFCFKKHSITVFSSRSEWSLPNEFKSFQSIKMLLIDSMGISENCISVSSRFRFLFRSYPQEMQSYNNKLQKDMVTSISVVLQWPETNINTIKIDVTNPTNSFFAVSFSNDHDDFRSECRCLYSMCTQVSQYRSFSDLLIGYQESNNKSLFKGLLSESDYDDKNDHSHTLIEILVGFICKSDDFKKAGSIWKQFIGIIRFHIEKGIQLRGVRTSGVDLKHCLLLQKLEMINYCILHPQGWICENRSAQHLFLKNGETLKIPSTQMIPTRTVDQIELEEMLMKRFVCDKTEMKKMQSIKFKSDIAAFKDSNPNCTFEDFIQWYSPSDYDIELKTLSSRMESNTDWITIFNNEPPCSIFSQTKLFDPSVQIEIAYDFIDSMTPHEAFSQLLIYSMETSVLSLKKGINVCIPDYNNKIEALEGIRQAKFTPESIDSFINILEEAFSLQQIIVSLIKKFGENERILCSLVKYKFVFPQNNDETQILNTVLSKLGIKQREAEVNISREYICKYSDDMNICQRLYFSEWNHQSVIASRSEEGLSLL